MTIVAVSYTPNLRDTWDALVDDSRNGLFLHKRDFIEYHGDRFKDASLVVFDGDSPIALFPAAETVGEWAVTSHPGLTFGGLLLRKGLRGSDAITAMDAVLDAYAGQGQSSLMVKLLPSQFERYPSAEIDYQLWRRGFKAIRKDLCSILPLQDRIPFNTLRGRSIKKANRAGVIVCNPDVTVFHDVLAEVLQARHRTQPVHSAVELDLLMQHFPSNIRLWGAEQAGVLLAVAATFHYGHVWHTQYLACTLAGRDLGALDLIIDHLIIEAAKDGCAFFSFGTSTEQGGKILNDGLLWQKESFGARSIVHTFVAGSTK